MADLANQGKLANLGNQGNLGDQGHDGILGPSTTAAADFWQRPWAAWPPIKGLTQRRLGLLQRLDIRCLADLAFFPPRAYEEAEISHKRELLQMKATYIFRVHLLAEPRVGRKGNLRYANLQMLAVDEEDESLYPIRVVIFNQLWLLQSITTQPYVYLKGQIDSDRGDLVLRNPELIKEQDLLQSTFRPIYPLTTGLKQKEMQKIVDLGLDLIDQTLARHPGWALHDPLTGVFGEVKKKLGLVPTMEAIQLLHRAKMRQEAELARRTLCLEELYLLMATMVVSKSQWKSQAEAQAIQRSAALTASMNQVVSFLPYQPTRAQVRVSNEVFADLRSTRPMNRLIQGDVGSGKTLIALLALAMVAFSSYQAAFLAPSAILARQHYQKLQPILEKVGLRVGFLIADLPLAEKQRIYADCAQGKIDILVGTHALFQENLHFANLNLVICDEQHRFGVRQRAALLGKGRAGRRPHMMVMSATPIPRTLALLTYADLDLSVLDEIPQNRPPVETLVLQNREEAKAWTILREALAAEGQAYIVCPLIHENEDLDLASVEKTFVRIQGAFPAYRVGLVHGELPQEEAEAVMEDYLAGKIHILVATTIIEVGIDNPKANCMVIYNAERFGLAQIHQLRGRIGRGSLGGTCILLTPVQAGPSLSRLRDVEGCRNGFDLAERDLARRGPGDFLGTRQHGAPSFTFFSVTRDQDIFTSMLSLVRKHFGEDEVDPELMAALEAALAERYPAFLRANFQE